MKLDIRPLTPDRWDDLETVFRARGCSVARGCWCMYYRRSGTWSPPSGLSRAEGNRRALQALAESGPAPGLIGYRDGQPVGWVSLAPREAFAKLARSQVMKPVDERAVWSVICFVVPAEFRGQGVAKALLDGAVTYARRQGARLLEAYPVDVDGEARDDNLWFGTASMFEAAGFVEVARRKPSRPVVRLALAGPTARRSKP
jgi:ribosomal protein S18 acetylase RimI-like enzyme